jgi:hypothetical protein
MIDNYLKAAAAMTALLTGWTIVRALYRRFSDGVAGNAVAEDSLGCLTNCRRGVCLYDQPANGDSGDRKECDFPTMSNAKK